MGKSINFSQLGGYPLCQDDIDYLQQAYSEIFTALGSIGGTVPYSVKGMVVSGAGNTASDGWFYYLGDFIKFTGGTVVPTGTDVAMVSITTSSLPLTFYDSSAQDVIIEKTATLVAGPSSTGAGGFPLSSLVPFGVALGLNYRESAWNSIAVATGAGHGTITGTVYYKKDFMANTLRLKGVLSAASPADFAAAPSLTYTVVATLPAAYWPASINKPFFAIGIFATEVLDHSGTSYFNTLTCLLNNAGQIGMVWRKPDASVAGYGVQFDVIVSLD